MLACSFTGHRTIETAHKANIEDLVLRSIDYAYSKGCREFYTGGALGFDTLAAKLLIFYRVEHPDIKLNLILPCRNQNERWNERQTDMYNYILSRADHIEYVSDQYTDGCMKMRNQRLVELADAVIAYAGRERSGAAQTVRMALSAGKEVYNLYPHLAARADG